jgi:hypothetical protein
MLVFRASVVRTSLDHDDRCGGRVPAEGGLSMSEGLTQAYGYSLEKLDRAVSRAMVDRDYRQRLLDDARAALQEEGVDLPAEVRVTFHELDLNDRHYFLPPILEEGQSIGVARAFMLGANYPRTSEEPGW